MLHFLLQLFELFLSLLLVLCLLGFGTLKINLQLAVHVVSELELLLYPHFISELLLSFNLILQVVKEKVASRELNVFH